MTSGIDCGLHNYRQIEVRKKSDRAVVELVQRLSDERFFIKKTFQDKSLKAIFEEIQALDHPGIVGIEEIIEDGNNLVVFEQYLSGETLEYCTPPDYKTAVRWALQLCDTLDFLHNKGILHRDLKPGNIMYYEDRLILFDFDIARTIKSEKEKDTTHIGTRGYAPPEQFGFAQTDERSDIFSLGVLLGEWQQVENPPLARVVKKCTALDPKDRYQSIKQLSSAIRSCEKTQIKRIAWIAAPVTAVLIALMVFALWPDTDLPAEDLPDTEIVTMDPQPPPTPTDSPAVDDTKDEPDTTEEPAQTTVTVNTITELQEALLSSASTIYLTTGITDYDMDLHIPSDKTVIISEQGIEISVRNMIVEGAIISTVENTILRVSADEFLSGFTLSNTENFFGIDNIYEPVEFSWMTYDSGSERTTGWWPAAVIVDNEDQVFEAIKSGTIYRLWLRGTFNITENFYVNVIHFIKDSDITIEAGVNAYVTFVDMGGWRSKFTVKGLLTGSTIYMGSDGSMLDLNGDIYNGPGIELRWNYATNEWEEQ